MSHIPTDQQVRDFFAWSDLLDHDVLRPLSHIKGNWEVMWDRESQSYEPEEDSFAHQLNVLIEDIAMTARPTRYHDNEDDVVAMYLAKHSESPLFKKGGRWQGDDYHFVLEQGGFDDIDQGELLTAAVGRACAAIRHGESHYDQMEEGHRFMLAGILSIILYHRSNDEES